jgi:hypothetical protein
VDRCCFWVFEGGERVVVWCEWGEKDALIWSLAGYAKRNGVCFLNSFLKFSGFACMHVCENGWVDG